MEQTIGTCSICGGEVRAYYGVWMSILPPPPPSCANCGARVAIHGPVIPMRATRTSSTAAIVYVVDSHGNYLVDGRGSFVTCSSGTERTA
jgi:hypothetical protein